MEAFIWKKNQYVYFSVSWYLAWCFLINFISLDAICLQMTENLIQIDLYKTARRAVIPEITCFRHSLIQHPRCYSRIWLSLPPWIWFPSFGIQAHLYLERLLASPNLCPYSLENLRGKIIAYLFFSTTVPAKIVGFNLINPSWVTWSHLSPPIREQNAVSPLHKNESHSKSTFCKSNLFLSPAKLAYMPN